jgi:hypothetical protein
MPSWRARQAIDRKLMSRPLPRASRTKRLSARLVAIVEDIFRRWCAGRAQPCWTVFLIVEGRDVVT